MKRARDYIVNENDLKNNIINDNDDDNNDDDNDIKDITKVTKIGSDNTKEDNKDINTKEDNKDIDTKEDNKDIDTKVLLKVVGLKYYLDNDGYSYLDTALKNEVISMKRDAENEYDCNCIKVFTGKYQIGCIAAAQAIPMSPLLDTYTYTIISNIRIRARDRQSEYLILEMNILIPNTIDNQHRIEDIAFLGPSIETKHDNYKKQKPNNVKIPNGSFNLAQSNLNLARRCVGDSFNEIMQSKSYILPTVEFFKSMAYGHPSDTEWYAQFGLRPPIDWIVSPAKYLDTSTVPYSTNATIKSNEIEKEKLMIDKMNAVQNCWHDDFIKEIVDVLNSPDFFSQIPGESVTKKDQLIAVFGGLGYVLGQKTKNLILCQVQLTILLLLLLLLLLSSLSLSSSSSSLSSSSSSLSSSLSSSSSSSIISKGNIFQ